MREQKFGETSSLFTDGRDGINIPTPYEPHTTAEGPRGNRMPQDTKTNPAGNSCGPCQHLPLGNSSPAEGGTKKQGRYLLYPQQSSGAKPAQRLRTPPSISVSFPINAKEA